MKLLLTADTVGGVFTWALELARALRAAGDEVVLATSGPTASPDQRARIGAAGIGAWHHRALRLEWEPDPWADQLAAGRWLRELVAREAPDILQLSSFGLAAGGWPVPVIVVAHSDVVSWWRAVHGQDPPAGWNAYREWVAAGLAAADLVVCPSEAARAELHAAYDLPTRRTVTIHNGLALAPAVAVAKQPRVLGAGRLWDEAKNMGALAGAAGTLPAGTVQLAGETRGRAAPGCAMLGPLDAEALAGHRRRALVFAAPARYEPFGLAILEAARDRCALVLGDIPSLRELWDGAAVFVAPGDEDALGSALARLLSGPQRAHGLGERARSCSLRYDAATMAGAYRRIHAMLRAGSSGAVAA